MRLVVAESRHPKLMLLEIITQQLASPTYPILGWRVRRRSAVRWLINHGPGSRCPSEGFVALAGGPVCRAMGPVALAVPVPWRVLLYKDTDRHVAELTLSAARERHRPSRGSPRALLAPQRTRSPLVDRRAALARPHVAGFRRLGCPNV
jgi:hypothetical protein